MSADHFATDAEPERAGPRGGCMLAILHLAIIGAVIAAGVYVWATSLSDFRVCIVGARVAPFACPMVDESRGGIIMEQHL